MNTLHINNAPRKLAHFFVMALLVFTVGESSGNPLPPPAAEEAQPPMHNYLIGPGDSVNIIVWRNPEVSMSVPVRPDGKITTPLVDDLPAVWQAAKENEYLEDTLTSPHTQLSIISHSQSVPVFPTRFIWC